MCATDPSEATGDEYRANPPIGSAVEARLTGVAGPVALGRGVLIDRISDDDAGAVMDACTPEGVGFKPIRQFGQRYSLVREVDPAEQEEHPFRWDPDGVLWDALAYSRLIRDNGYSTEYAARVTDHDDGRRTIVYTLGSEGKHAYRLRQGREWLNHREGEDLAALLAAYWRVGPELPGRVKRALWRVEYATWLRWADLMVSVLVSGLEALLKTDRGHATTQFKARASALAEELAIDGIDGDLCERIYEMRSDWVHGAHVQLYPTGQVADEAERVRGHVDRGDAEQRALAEVAAVQDLLRAALAAASRTRRSPPCSLTTTRYASAGPPRLS